MNKFMILDDNHVDITLLLHLSLILYRMFAFIPRLIHRWTTVPSAPLCRQSQLSSYTVEMASEAVMAANPAKRVKLTGRAFYESIGSPSMVVAPMVDRSEFVSLYVSICISIPC